MGSGRKVKTAIIPAAGLGTRFLPVTKSTPKEMLPIIDAPTIQYIVEEAWAANIERVILVNGHHKSTIEDHFDHNYELEDTLLKRGKTQEVEALRAIVAQGHVISIRQKEPLGLGHAVWAAYPVVGDEPVAVLLGDDVIRPGPNGESATLEMITAFEKKALGQIALMQVPRSEIHKYGAAEGREDSEDPRCFHISGLVEKPPLGTEKTDRAVVGRHVLPASIWPILKETKPGQGGEIQLTDALETLRLKEGLMGFRFSGRRVDAGDRIGYLTANVLEALGRPSLRQQTLDMLGEVLREAGYFMEAKPTTKGKGS